ncbi:MAG: squalene-hopene/tetraprenyl-beta-curcumene cyclase [Candidatus Eremiobacteraeota bacterium]|jgi:hypothetical protein|nr:squalene-hopene/tetraprenyl-beta-curcumene cyclase [Candidatus Eremiobacteraeota bacterium]
MSGQLVSHAAARLEAGVAKAASFLRERLRSGAYGLACIGGDGLPRVSDDKGHVFVAAFIAEAMTGLFDEIDRTIVLVRILSEENGGQWGFAPPMSFHDDAYRVFHVDADDTAYVLRTLRRLGANRNPECLAQFYREPERLFATFDAPGATALTAEPSPQHNLLAHPDVNANVFLALRGTHLEALVDYELLLRTQDASGYWRSYFYPSLLFGTLLALDAMYGNPALHGIPAFADATARALAFVAGAQSADGSWGTAGDPYETALAVAALAGRDEHDAAMQRGVEYLLSTMAADGSWTSEACVWEFHAGETDVWRAYDRHRAYVTARCMTALRRGAGQIATAP